MNGWQELRALLTEALALVEEAEALSRDGTATLWPTKRAMEKLGKRMAEAGEWMRKAGFTGYRMVRDESGQVIRLEWWP